jgi:hypothetical protein
MAKKDTLIPPGPPTNVSPRAMSIGRTIDRLCRLPGTYAITVTVPSNRREPWLVQLHRLDTMRRFELSR